MFALVKKLVADLDLQEESRLVPICHAARLFVLPSLLQVGAVAGAIERHLTLLATALWTDTAVYGRAETLLLVFFANRTNHRMRLRKHYDINTGLVTCGA